MSNYNRVILIGRVAANPELRYTATGKAVVGFRLAVDRRFSGAGGEKEADFFQITAWQKLAEICNEFLTLGKLIMIEGRLQSRTYEGQDGQKRTAFEIVADDMRMLGAREGGGGESGPRSGGRPGPGASASPRGREAGGSGRSEFGGGESFDPGMDDEVPF